MALYAARDKEDGDKWRSRYFVRLCKTQPAIDETGCYPLQGLLVLRNQAPPLKPGECIKVKIVIDNE